MKNSNPYQGPSHQHAIDCFEALDKYLHQSGSPTLASAFRMLYNAFMEEMRAKEQAAQLSTKLIIDLLEKGDKSWN